MSSLNVQVYTIKENVDQMNEKIAGMERKQNEMKVSEIIYNS